MALEDGHCSMATAHWKTGAEGEAERSECVYVIIVFSPSSTLWHPYGTTVVIYFSNSLCPTPHFLKSPYRVHRRRNFNRFFTLLEIL